MPKQSFLIGFSIFLFIGLIAFGIGYWFAKSPQPKTEKEVVAVAEPIKTKMVEEKTEDPFEDEKVPNKYYRVEGKQLLGPDGKPVRLRGVNFNTPWLTYSPADIQDLKEMGVNCIFYGCELAFFDNNPKEASFSKHCQNQIKMLADAGIGVIPYCVGVRGNHFRPRHTKAETIAAWKEVIDKLGDNPGVIGWSSNRESWNEPIRERHNDAISAIRKIDPHRPIFVNCSVYGHLKTKEFLLDDANVIYDFAQGDRYSKTGIDLEYPLAMREKYNVPVMFSAWTIGEPSNRLKDLTYVKNVISSLEESEISWAFKGLHPRTRTIGNPDEDANWMKREQTDIFMLLRKAMRSPESFNKKSQQYDPGIWDNPLEWVNVCMLDEKSNELKQSIVEIAETKIPECVQRRYLFKDQKITVRSCFDPETQMVVHRIELHNIDPDAVKIGFQFPKENDIPKVSMEGNRATFDTANEQILIGWNNEAKLTPPIRKELKVINAKYGEDNRWIDVTEKMQSLVAKDSLIFTVTPSFGGPAKEVAKQLALTYSMGGEEHTKTISLWHTFWIQADKCFRFNIEKQRVFEFVVAKGLKSLPEKLPTFDEVVKKQSR